MSMHKCEHPHCLLFSIDILTNNTYILRKYVWTELSFFSEQAARTAFIFPPALDDQIRVHCKHPPPPHKYGSLCLIAHYLLDLKDHVYNNMNKPASEPLAFTNNMDDTTTETSDKRVSIWNTVQHLYNSTNNATTETTASYNYCKWARQHLKRLCSNLKAACENSALYNNVGKSTSKILA